MTNLSKVSPFGSIDRAWDAFFDAGYPGYNSKTRGLSYEIKPGDDAVVAEVEVPGCNPKDVKVNCEGRAIHVTTPRGNAYFTVGARIDMDHIEASIRHGLLTLRVPKREARKVEVRVVDNKE
jgi:HSP20 family molecular chaperone IbpA